MENDRIVSEKDPYLREIYAAGYDRVINDHISQEIVLVRTSDGFTKRLPLPRLTDAPYNIIRARLRDGTIHEWLCEKDGSAERFRRLLSNETKL